MKELQLVSCQALVISSSFCLPWALAAEPQVQILSPVDGSRITKTKIRFSSAAKWRVRQGARQTSIFFW